MKKIKLKELPVIVQIVFWFGLLQLSFFLLGFLAGMFEVLISP